ncbi:flagellar basal body L-ring protein FlgH [Herbaspirillum sp. HC18]|nr:flagellar basal body L-ring protein FlgH [Herbaspirillum sp. HC18]
MRAPLISMAALLLSACAAIEPQQARPGPVDETIPPAQAVRKGQSGGVFAPEASWSLTSDSRAFRSGDVVTIVLQETTLASKKAGTSFDKKSDLTVKPTVIGSSTLKTNIDLGAQRDFAGNASSTQQNALQGAITVIVQEVLPNGLLRVAGEKTLYLNQGEEFIRLRGYVRAADIDTDNRVSSQRIADARIAYSGQGALADANAPGWLTRFFTSPWMPF